MQSAATPASLSAATWSCISAISGDTTTVSPRMTSAGIWKHSDLPEPVGITVSALRPASRAAIAASWPGRKFSNPKTLPQHSACLQDWLSGCGHQSHRIAFAAPVVECPVRRSGRVNVLLE